MFGTIDISMATQRLHKKTDNVNLENNIVDNFLSPSLCIVKKDINNIAATIKFTAEYKVIFMVFGLIT